MKPETGPAPRLSRLSRLAARVGMALVLGAVYVSGTRLGNAEDGAALARAEQVAAAIRPLAKGELAAFVVAETVRQAPDIAVVTREGTERKLSDWRGRTVLVNLWATWCAPCRHEMPALDALQEKLGGEQFEVVAINVDRGGPAKGEAFYSEIGLKSLAYYHDPSSRIFRELKAFGMPTTLLISPDGYEVGRLAGPAEWQSEDALALVRAAIAAGGGS